MIRTTSAAGSPLSATFVRDTGLVVPPQVRAQVPDGNGDPVEDPLESPEGGDPGGVGVAPGDDTLETSEVPDALVSEFSSLTTPYCWVITEDLVARYDGAEPSAVGKSGPAEAMAQDVQEALNSGKFFRLTDDQGRAFAIGRLYDPSGDNERAPLDDFGRENWDATTVEYRVEGQWQAV